VLLFASLSCLGCGDNGLSTVSGTVTYCGKPVTGGVITFLLVENDRELTRMFGGIDHEGNFRITDVPRGRLLVGIETETTKATIDYVGQEHTMLRYIPIPTKYSDPYTSGLSCDVQSQHVRDVFFDLRE
jgi:hypothetical protein